MIGDLLRSVKIDTPATRLGCHYALLPERAILTLGGSELLTLALACSLRRKTTTLELGVSDAIRSVGWCGKTFHAHWRSLADKGWLHGDRFAMTDRARVKPGERFGKVWIGRITNTGAAAFRLACVLALRTGRDGRLYGSRRQLADLLGRSTRTVRRHLATLRLLGYRIGTRFFDGAEKTVRSARKKLAGVSVKRSGQRLNDRMKRVRSAARMTDADWERERHRQRALIASLMGK